VQCGICARSCASGALCEAGEADSGIAPALDSASTQLIGFGLVDVSVAQT
jgi:hypothetical protein